MWATRASFTGALTLPSVPTEAATPVTITDDSKYDAWPVICRAADRSLLVGYTKADDHHLDASGKAVLKRSTDDGSSWGSEVTIYDHASLFASVMGLGVSRTGRVIATLWRDSGGGGATDGVAGIVYSDDHGATWSSWVDLVTSFTNVEFGTGPAIVTGDGGLLLPIEGTAGGTILNRSVHTLRSTDDGLTWGGEVTVAAYGARPYYESKLVRLRDGTIRCLHRTSGGTGTHYVNTSTDDGYTWDTPASVFDGYGAPSVTRLRADGLVAVTRRNSDAACVAHTSTDGGLTWGSAIVVDDTMYEMEYGAPVELEDGTVLVVYGSQPTSALTNSDIKAAVLS